MAGVVAGTTTYGLNAYEYNTSHTGNTAAARENNLTESLINGGAVFIGAAQMKYISGMLNNANAFLRGGGRLTTVLGSDIGVGAAGEYVQTGQVSVNGVAMSAVFSATGNLIGLKSLAKKAPANLPRVEVSAEMPPVEVPGTPVLNKATSNGEARPSTVKLGDGKGSKINEEVLAVTSDPNVTPEGLVEVKGKVDAIQNRGLRRRVDQNIKKAADGLPDDAYLAYQQLDYNNLKGQVDHIFDRHNALHSTDVRNIEDYVGRTNDIEVLNDLKSKLSTKEHKYGGVTNDYKTLYSAIDNKISALQPKPVKTNTQIREDVYSMLTNKASTGKGLSPDDVTMVKQYIATIQDEAQLTELMTQLQGKKMAGADKRAIKEAIQLKSGELKNVAKPRVEVAENTPQTPKYNEVYIDPHHIELQDPATPHLDPSIRNRGG